MHAPPGPPLGLRAANYHGIQTPFPPGTIMVGFTDGLIEARGSTWKRVWLRSRPSCTGYVASDEILDDLLEAAPCSTSSTTSSSWSCATYRCERRSRRCG